ncbi:MAG: ABC transporter ATP-binding protein [Candidatus Izimaplasma sp.]|nr:ABC transporter ATP-binding protein [Candidatus Izimaplasma bacterium]
MENIIEFSKLTKYYGDVCGCKDINFTVKQGEIFGFIGPNGAGKSTTLRTMLGLLYPTSGSVNIFGKDAIKFGPELRHDIGYLPSEVFYYDNMTVKQLLHYAASFYHGNFEDRIQELSELMELDLTRKISDLSYGNKKKVGIVQGLLHHPKLIILDEPTSGLDPLMQQKFFNLIKRENDNGATVLFSSHILSEVQALCDRVAIIKDGVIIDIQNIKELKKETYKKITLVGTDLPTKQLSLKGITNWETIDHTVTFLYNGSIKQLLLELQKIKLDDVLIENPSLEEIFMHYYE